MRENNRSEGESGFDKIQLIRSRLFFLGQVLNTNKYNIRGHQWILEK